jgi:5-(carboxyamino)imidazole ribonucleotide synthase
VLGTPGAYLHLYGKTSTKPHRKMGHLTVLHANPEAALHRALTLQKQLKVTSR